MNEKVFLRARIKLASLYTVGVIIIFAGGISINYWLDKILAEPNVDPLLHSIEGLTVILIAALSYHFAGKTLEPIEASYEKQKKFVADAAHELRTPLAVMKTGAEATMAGEATTGDYKILTAELLEEVDYMSAIVSDLLLLAKLDGHHSRKHAPITLSEIVEAQSKHMQSYARSQHIELTCNSLNDGLVSGNQSDLQCLVTNLLRNAIDYNNPQGSVMVSIEKKKQMMVLTVRDTGIGIRDEDMPHIYDRFYKVDQTRGQHKGGAGLGLAIVKEIVRDHRAQISVSSKVGKGTTVVVTFSAVNS